MNNMSNANQIEQVKILEQTFSQSTALIEPQSITDVLRGKSFKGSHPDVITIGKTITQRILDVAYDARLLSAATSVAEAVEDCLQRTYMEAGNQHDCDESIIQVDASKTGRVTSVNWTDQDTEANKDAMSLSDTTPATEMASYRFALTNAVAAANRSEVFKSLCLELVLGENLMISTKLCEFYPDAYTAKQLDF